MCNKHTSYLLALVRGFIIIMAVVYISKQNQGKHSEVLHTWVDEQEHFLDHIF